MSAHSEPNVMSRDGRRSKREVVVITGASAGVGRATARAFGERGACVALIARGEAGLRGAQCDVESAGGEALTFVADVADAEALERAAAAAEERFGPIDVWVNDAMVTVFSPAHEMTADEYRRVTEVTYLGCVNGTLAALRRMLPRDRGTIVQVGSALAYRGIPLQSAYCGAKHAIQGFTESVRCELYHDHSNVWITMVQLPAMNTPQFGWLRSRLARRAQPMPPIYEPEVAARAIVWSARHRRRELNVGLPTLQAVIANKIAPGLLDRYLGRIGYKAQQTDEREDPARPDNLWQPLDATGPDRGARGGFSARARTHSAELWAVTHRAALAAAGAATAGGAALAVRAAKRRGHRVERTLPPP